MHVLVLEPDSIYFLKLHSMHFGRNPRTDSTFYHFFLSLIEPGISANLLH